MLDLALGAMQNHHSGILAAFKRALRNQFPWQNVIVIAESRAHRPMNLAQIQEETEPLSHVSREDVYAKRRSCVVDRRNDLHESAGRAPMPALRQPTLNSDAICSAKIPSPVMRVCH